MTIANCMNETYLELGTDVTFCHACGSRLTINANFCNDCGCKQRNYDLFESSESEEDLIRKYFKYEYNYQTICLFLENFHGIDISLRTLKRRLAQYVLKKASTDMLDETLCSIIEREVKGSPPNPLLFA